MILSPEQLIKIKSAVKNKTKSWYVFFIKLSNVLII